MKTLPARCRHRPWIVLALALLLPAGALRAHTMPYSAVMLDFQPDAVAVEMILPLQELELSFKQPLLARPDAVVAEHGPALRDYILAHVHPAAPDGRPWTVEVSGMEVKPNEQVPDLTVHLRMCPPADAPLHKFAFNYDVIVHEVVSHKTFVFVRNAGDGAPERSAGQVPPLPEAIGLIRYLVYTVPIDRTRGG